ncbi:MAG: site-specific integrase [Oscillibacter sp.]|nr:site-specific integrase [Oscillibacter sp.]
MSRKTILPNISYDTQRRSYYVTIRRPAPPDGAPRRTTRCYPTLELAIQALDRTGAQEIMIQGGDLEKLTLGQWLTYWLEQIIKPSRSASTVHGYTMIIRNHLSPALGGILLTKLTAVQIQLYLNRMQAEGLCANTVRKHYMLLHNALEHARRQDLVVRNVSAYVTPPSVSAPTHHFYDSETMARLFEILAGTTMEPVVKLAGYLGLRRAEICGLKWNHVDRERKVITIAEARTAVNGRSVNKSTKSRSSIRRLGYAGIADMEELIERLWNQRIEEMERLGDRYEDRGYVVCHDGGLPYQADYLSSRLQRVLSKTELPYVTLHGLRHSFASIANSRNVPLFGISRALGHSTTSTTSRIYMHLFDDTHLSVVQAVGEAVGGAGDPPEVPGPPSPMYGRHA